MRSVVGKVCALSCLLASMFTCPLTAREKPNPTPLEPAQPAAEFSRAYESAREPRVLVLCGLDGGIAPRDAADKAGTSQQVVAPATFYQRVGHNILSFDTAGNAETLRIDIEQILGEANVRLVNLNGLAEKDIREVELERQRGGDEAVNLLGTKVNADIVVTIRMLPAADRQAVYRVLVETVNVTNGAKIGGYAFDWKLALDAPTIKRYADQMTAKWMKQFAGYYSRRGNPAAQYVVRLMGVGDAQTLRKARDAFARIPGMKKVTEGDFAKGRDDAMATMEMSYDGSPLDLAVDLQEVARRELEMRVDAVDASTGAISLIAENKVVYPGRVLIDEELPDHKEALEQFRKVYADRGSVSVAVVMSREITDIERQSPKIAGQISKAAGAPDQPLVVVNLGMTRPDQPDPNRFLKPNGEKAAQIDRAFADARIQNYLIQRLGMVGIRVMDESAVRERLKKQGDVERVVFGDKELSLLIGQKGGADVVVNIVGRSASSAADVQTLGYTFRAVGAAGEVLGADGYDLDLKPGRLNFDEAMKDMSDRMAGSLAMQMWRNWAPPTVMAVRITNAKSPREVSAMCTFFRDSIPGVTAVSFVSHDVAEGTGIGELTIRYTQTFDELIRSITRLGTKLPFDFDSHEATRDHLVIKIRD